MNKLVIILFLSILTTACSSLRFKYGFNSRNKTIENIYDLYYKNGNLKMVTKVKFISQENTIDGARYIKRRTKWYYENGKIKADTIEEKITSSWGYLDMKAVYKSYSKNGKMTKNKVKKKQSGW